MGVIKKVLYRGQILGKPRHRNFFLDMEENIHIHHRDLRIELSRGEFEDICAAFGKQSKELLAIIQEKEYQDGKLANANQDDVRIWTESQLKHEVKYHPQRFSIEACSDGYHFHYRNYKLLIDEAEFRQLVKLFKYIDVDAPCAATYTEVLELLEANDLDFVQDAGNVPDKILSIAVASYHLPKVREIFKLIGFTQEAQQGLVCYQGPLLKVLVATDKKRSILDYRHLRGLNQTERLVDFLTHQGAGMEPNLLNRIKCQVLDLYYALKASQQPMPVETDMQLWLWSPANQQVIFPYSQPGCDGPASAKPLYKSWSELLNRLGLAFIKPGKVRFTTEAQLLITNQITQTLQQEVATCAAVETIHLMGSALRQEMGTYLAPFVHGPQAKLGSDIDILIEIHPAREKEIPPHWHLINPESSSGCAVYHITQIPLTKGAEEWTKRHPNIPFTHHLVDAYIFFPSQGHEEKKNAFLRKFNAQRFYDRSRDGLITQESQEVKIAQLLTERYDLTNVIVEPMPVSTENLLYKVFSDQQDAILKLFKVAGNFKNARIAEHTAYEAELITQLVARGIVTAKLFSPKPGADTTLNGFPALLFERVVGAELSRPEYPIDAIAPALAKLHQVQMETPLQLTQAFSFADYCQIWLPQFPIYHQNPTLPPELKATFDQLAPWINQCQEADFLQKLFASSPLVHCHGDVTPRNVIINQAGAACFFDFNNGYYAPRILDLLDGGIEFSLADKYIHLADFARFDAFIAHYTPKNPLTELEIAHLTQWTILLGLIKFTKEIRVLLERPKEQLRRQRAMAIAGFLLSRFTPPQP